MRYLISILLFVAAANAQFGNIFEQMFSGNAGGHQQHHQPQQNPSDSGMYRQRYEQCTCSCFFSPRSLVTAEFFPMSKQLC
jgi:hypothetical protein